MRERRTKPKTSGDRADHETKGSRRSGQRDGLAEVDGMVKLLTREIVPPKSKIVQLPRAQGNFRALGDSRSAAPGSALKTSTPNHVDPRR